MSGTIVAGILILAVLGLIFIRLVRFLIKAALLLALIGAIGYEILKAKGLVP